MEGYEKVSLMKVSAPFVVLAMAALVALAGCATPSPQKTEEGPADEMPAADSPACGPSGTSTHVALQPGHRLVLGGEDDDVPTIEVVTVLDETRVVDGVTTRVVEERETVDGNLTGLSRRYVAVCPGTGDVYLYGEEETTYDGALAETEAWEAGKAGAEAGLLLPGRPALGQVYATPDGPGAAEQVEVADLDATVTVPAGTFEHVLRLEVISPADDEDEEADEDEDDTESVWYAPGVGVVREDDLVLLAYGPAGTFEVPTTVPCVPELDEEDDEDDEEEEDEEEEDDDGCPEEDDGPPADPPATTFTESVDNCTFASSGRNPFFILEPGYVLLLKGTDDGEPVEVKITVSDETKTVDGVETRVILEEEYEDDELVERSWNYFAFCTETGSVFYFGEAVDIYEDGELESHEGAWLAGVDGAEAGVIMPGAPEVGMKHFQEHAPGVAMDHAEVVAVNETVTTPAGTFTGALKVKETTSLEPGAVDYKWYAPGVGLLVDGPVKLVEYGTDI